MKNEERKQGKISDFDILVKLGTGSFGIVYKVKNKSIEFIIVSIY